jgi:predicted metal-dependent hydrolase
MAGAIEFNAWQPGPELQPFGIRNEIFTASRFVSRCMPLTGLIRLWTERLRVTNAAADLRSSIQKHLRKLAAQELSPRVMELAAVHGLSVSRVSVRNQRSRWVVFAAGTISLYWRLIQAPDFVRDQHHPARTGAWAAYEPFGKVLAGGGAAVS